MAALPGLAQEGNRVLPDLVEYDRFLTRFGITQDELISRREGSPSQPGRRTGATDRGLVPRPGLHGRFAAAFWRFGQPAGCQRRNAVPWSSTHSASSPYGLRSGSSAWPPAARTRSTAAAMSSTR